MGTFRARDVRIYRPYPDEVPWDLLAAAGLDEADPTAVLDLDFLRVAKHEGTVAGLYAIRPLQSPRYELVTLIVDERYRRQGLGRWLLGHAIGLAETKGGREIVVRAPASRRFFARAGFEPLESDLLLRLTPE